MALPVRLTTLVALLLLLTGCLSVGPLGVENARSAGGLAYDLAGEGPLVVLIHGTNLDRRMWEEEEAWLKKDVRVLRYDVRGQGASEFPTEAYSNHGDLIALLDELGETDVTLVGLSAGAQVAVDVALEAPRLVRRMVLVSPSLLGYVPKDMPPFLGELMAALRARDFETAKEVLLASSIMSVPEEDAGRVRLMVKENMRLFTIPYSLVEQVSPPALERLEDIKASALVLVGDNDVEAIRTQGKLLAGRLPNARQVTIRGGGHLLNMTSPDSFRKELSAFLALADRALDTGQAGT